MAVNIKKKKEKENPTLQSPFRSLQTLSHAFLQNGAREENNLVQKH